MNKVKAASVQHTPIFLNINETVELTNEFIEEAADSGADIIVFPETWLPGYPVWLDYSPNAALWGNKPARDLYTILYDNSLTIPGGHFNSVFQKAVDTKTIIVLGAHELSGKTLYNTQVCINGGNQTYKIHRKLMPTYNERLIWGRGDGSTINYIESEYGNIGGLICWEHWMPLARATMHSFNESIHIAQWPFVKELNQIASRHYAFEGGCFVIAAGGMLSKGDAIEGIKSVMPKDSSALDIINEIPVEDDELLLKGGSAVIAPDARYIAEPKYGAKEIIYADMDLDEIKSAALELDTDGHYSRPDVFNLTVNTEPQKNVNLNN